jgi:hypothetical protein
MIIGNWIITDEWVSLDDEFSSYVKRVYNASPNAVYRNQSIQIYVNSRSNGFIFTGDSHHLWFSMTEMKEAYVSMYGREIFFPTYEMARDRVDTFLIKLNKLKAFL